MKPTNPARKVPNSAPALIAVPSVPRAAPSSVATIAAPALSMTLFPGLCGLSISFQPFSASTSPQPFLLFESALRQSRRAIVSLVHS